ncbi:MAG: hypothetical protein A3I02_15555 [Betaproteobacteria bacterium RIFCSPLOWO2_02_FULL_67_26]|nr:MAG: hypothetical protein A3I02_15555 [Betaproteobacteria bacterium RIFCSPLOWO2_02_FULL_67_26]
MRLGRHVLAAGILAVSLITSGPSWSYGWLSHWRIVETNWEALSRNLCPDAGGVQRPDLTRKEYERPAIANAAALGAVISDLSYVYPPTPRRFSDLLHYTGTGRFTDTVTRTACELGDRELLAFAVGLRSHYWADRLGHHHGTNVIVASLPNKAPNHLRGIPRLVYERDTATHRMVEIQALSAVDLSLTLVEAASVFIGRADESRELAARVEKLLGASFGVFYGKAMLELVPDLNRIIEFSGRVASVTCSAIDTAYGEAPPSSKDNLQLLDRCKQRLRSDEAKDKDAAQRHQQRRSNLLRNIQLVKQFPSIVTTYRKSLNDVAQGISKHAGPLPDYNLDTNLPAAGGQSRIADRTFCGLVDTWGKSCKDGSVFSLTEKVRFDWKQYLDEGLRARADGPKGGGGFVHSPSK